MEASLPYWIDPMAPTLTQERFREPGWIFERKFDGIRLLAYNEGTDVRLFSRNRLPQHLPSVASAIARLPSEDLILDGELTWSDGRIEYHLFDILRQDDRDLTGLPWRDRRYRLEALPLGTPLDLVALVDHARPWELARVSGWEGVIAKQIDSPYESKRSRHWMKMKCEVEGRFVVGGFTEPRGSRRGLGALLVGRREGANLVFAGKVGTGLDTRMLIELRRRLDLLEIPGAPFTAGSGLPRADVHWVTPSIEVDVGFIEWTVHNKLRHPRLLAVREAP